MTFTSMVGQWAWWRRRFQWQYCPLHGWVPLWVWAGACCKFYTVDDSGILTPQPPWNNPLAE